VLRGFARDKKEVRDSSILCFTLDRLTALFLEPLPKGSKKIAHPAPGKHTSKDE